MINRAKFTTVSVLLLMALYRAHCSETTPAVGTKDRDGNLVIYVFPSISLRPDTLYMTLKDDYGFILFNDGTEKVPSMRIVVAGRKEGKIYEARSWDEVEPVLEKIPSGSRIYEYGKCLVPTYYGLPEETWKKFTNLLKKRRLKFREDEPRLTCTCPLSG